MFYNVEKFAMLLVKYKLTPNQFFFAYLLHDGRYDLLKKYCNVETGVGLFKADDLRALEEKGYVVNINPIENNIQQAYMDSFICTSTFKELAFLEYEEPLQELMKVYPQILSKDSRNFPAKSIDPAILGPIYMKNINADYDTHIEVLGLTQYAVRNNLITTDVDKYVKSKMWEVIKEAKEKSIEFKEVIQPNGGKNGGKVYHPTDIMTFGKEKGELLSEIYHFQPTYIEWLIINVPAFRINIEEFEKLPNPTPMSHGFVSGSDSAKSVKSIKTFSELAKLDSGMHINVNWIKKLVSEGQIELKPVVDFKFSSEVIEKNASKFEEKNHVNTFEEFEDWEPTNEK